MSNRTVAAFVLLGLAVLGILHGVISLQSPYTDQQVRASLVDTWQAEATATLTVLSALLVCLVAAVWIKFQTRRTGDRVPSFLAIICLCAGIGIAIASHAALTLRVTRLTGQTFGKLYGLL